MNSSFVVLVPLLLASAGLAHGQAVRVLSGAPSGESRTQFTLPHAKDVVVDVRTVLPDGRVLRSGITSSGQPVDVDALRLLDHELEVGRFGKVHTTLRDRVEAAQPGAQIEVAFWLLEPADGFEPDRFIRESVSGFPEDLIGDAVRAARADALRMNALRLEPAVTTFAQHVRQAGGQTVVEGLGWPLVIASVNASAVSALAAHPLVDMAYVSQSTWVHEGDNAQGTMRTYNVHDQGVLADGSVRVLVNDVGAVQASNPYLPPVTVVASLSVSSHATGVAGNICNSHPQYYAASYTLPVIYDGPGTGDAGAPVVWEAGINQGIDFGNCSWWNFLKGKIEFLDRFFDYTIRNFSVMMFKSNGNQGSTSTPYGTTPGQGYNVTCTGNYNDNNDDDWGNDFMTSSSSWWNPQEGHEKPEVASPGDCVTTAGTGASGTQTCFGGTSSASPLTCGVATLFTSYDNTLLSQMTTVKATLMASAWHNVESDALLSDRDGAGGVHAKAAHSLIRDGQWWFQDVVDADFVGDVLDVTMSLAAGDDTRVVSLWQSSANAAYTTDVIDMDLDMAILAPDGTVVASSASAVDVFEIVGFRPQVSGDYTVRLTKQRFNGTSEPLTVAWSTRNDTGTARIGWAGSGPPFAVGQTSRWFFSDRYDGSNRDYVAWGALSDVSAGALGGGWAMPVGFDAISASIVSLPGWMGTLNPQGEKSALLPVPPVPGIAGLAVHFGLALWPPGAPISGAPEMVSDPTTMTILP